MKLRISSWRTVFSLPNKADKGLIISRDVTMTRCELSFRELSFR